MFAAELTGAGGGRLGSGPGERAALADRAARSADAAAARARRELDRATAQRDRQYQRVEETAAQPAVGEGPGQ
jgi:hypothetical protein